jgi:hypothetical protein
VTLPRGSKVPSKKYRAAVRPIVELLHYCGDAFFLH